MVAAALAAPVLLAEGAQAGWQGPDSQNPLHYLVIVALAHLVLQHVDGDGGVRRGILGDVPALGGAQHGEVGTSGVELPSTIQDLPTAGATVATVARR